ncbi:MAG: hypothetical protein AAF125_08020, partial [Chloroflexota bacterium]
MTQRNIVRTLGIVIAAILAVLMVLIFVPFHAALSIDEGGTVGELRVNNRFVLAPGDCVIATWSVEGVQAIYINNVPTTGQNEQQICTTLDSMQTLRITTSQNIDLTY